MGNREIDLTDVHAILIDMAKCFHAICERHGIAYYMLGGTMLGAVRHKGFIPWDDDMDFGIPRKDYVAFVAAAQKELPPRYRMLTADNSEYACLGIGKISDTKTICPEIFSVRTEEQLGVNIDVFPLDYTDGRTDVFSCNQWARMLFKFQKLMFVNAEERPWHKRLLANTAQKVFNIGRTTIPHYIDELMLKRKVEATHVANIFGAWAMRELVPKEVFGEPRLYEFGDARFYGVQDADAYLTQLYGDYMKIPSADNLHIHASSFFRID